MNHTWKYLHPTAVGWVLDHRLVPEVRAMFAAMASRMPDGGIEARYREVVEAIAPDMRHQAGGKSYHNPDAADWSNHPIWLAQAEERLTEYPLHSVVQEFFNKFVGQYGHSSIMELTGNPAVYVEGVSPWTAYQSFDNPLVRGQEFSTRAVRRKDWPMCREAMLHSPVEGVVNIEGRPTHLLPDLYNDIASATPHPELKAMHEAWLEIFEAEVEAWKVELRLPCETCDGDGYLIEGTHQLYREDCEDCNGTGKKYPWIKDPQAFRPALDRARWAIPSTIATGFCHAADIRTMGRVIQQGADFSNNSSTWNAIKASYEQALPGMKGMWGREAVAGTSRQLPGHLTLGFVEPKPEVVLKLVESDSPFPAHRPYQRRPNQYLDPMWDQLLQVHIEFQCSWAVARDWHRHRTAFPWHLNIVEGPKGFILHHRYQLLVSQQAVDQAMIDSYNLFIRFQKAGDMEKAMLCLPFGTTVSMSTTMGLRAAVYMLELRANAHGANFEYEAQAREALRQLKEQLGSELCEIVFPTT